MAKLPARPIRKPDPELRTLPIGGMGYVPLAAMRVAPDLECFLLAEAKYVSEKNLINALRIQRDDDGYHVAILTSRAGWVPDTDVKLPKDLLPIASLTVEIDPAVEISPRGSSRQEAI